MLRKTGHPGSRIERHVGASMRPQRNAAENRNFRAGGRRCDCASMRPQRNAAENIARN